MEEQNGIRGVHIVEIKSIGYFMRMTQFRNLFLPFKNVPSPVAESSRK